MTGWRVSILFAMAVALSLIAAPITMADWGQQASFSTSPVGESKYYEELPTLQYDELSIPAQNAVRQAIESPDGNHLVYGYDDFPEEFFYSDFALPGRGQYLVVYQGDRYYLTTFASGGFPFVYWGYELPFIGYGVVLAWSAHRVFQRELSPRFSILAAVPGVAFHLLGPEFDFPVLTPNHFFALGVLATGALVFGLLWEIDPMRS